MLLAADLIPSKVYDSDGNVSGYQVRAKAIDPDSIYKFQIKEEWIFDKESSRLFVRILGIAPVIPYRLSTGDIVANSERPVWWVYYPDLRPIFAKYEVYNPKNIGAQMTWEELFESRMFSSYIVKSTIDNPFDIPLSRYIQIIPYSVCLKVKRLKTKYLTTNNLSGVINKFLQITVRNL